MCSALQLHQPITAELLVTRRKIVRQPVVQHHLIVNLLNSTYFTVYFLCLRVSVDLTVGSIVIFCLTLERRRFQYT